MEKTLDVPPCELVPPPPPTVVGYAVAGVTVKVPLKYPPPPPPPPFLENLPF
jgi:hypothetical protein